MIPAALFLVFASLFYVTRVQSFSYDGLCYALDVEFAPPGNWFHPYHLLYSAFSKVVFSVVHAMVPSARAIFSMQDTNVIAGAVAVALLYVVISGRWGIWAGLFSAILFAVSRAFWAEVVDPGCYALAGLAAVITLGALIRYADAKDKSSHEPFLLGVIVGVATLFHYMIFLTIPAFLLAGSRSANLRWCAGMALAVGIPYGSVVFLFHAPPWTDAYQWFFGLALAPSADHGQLWWRWDLVQDAIAAWTGSVGSFFVVHLSTEILFAILVGGTLVWTWRRQDLSPRLRWALWSWIALMLLFQSFYNPGATRFRILWMPALLFLVGAASHSLWTSPAKRLIGALALVVLGVTNFRNSVQPRLRATSDHERVAWLNQQLGSSDLFLFMGSEQVSVLNVYMAYFGHTIPARSLYGYYFAHLDGNSTGLWDRIREAVRSGGQVWVESDLLKPAIQNQYDHALRLPAQSLEKTFGRLKADETRTGPNGYQISRVTT